MARKLASVQKIFNIRNIEGSDNLQVANILGWQAVIMRADKYQENQLVCFNEIDSWLPELPQYEFLRKNCWKDNENGKGFRIKTVKLRGTISQGLVIPLAADELGLPEGTDLTEKHDVKLYNPPIPACLKGLVKGVFPKFLSKTDEPRVQLLQSILTRHKGTPCYTSEKLDGTSCSIYLKDGEFGVCSRNLELKENPDAYWSTVRAQHIEEKMRNLSGVKGWPKNFAIQGEVIGLGIQGNPLQLDGRELRVFNIFDIDNFKYMNFIDHVKTLINAGFQTVPIVENNIPLDDDISEWVARSIGKSKLNPKKEREGIVIRPMIEVMDLEMAQGFGNGRLSFKVVSPVYLLSEND